MADNVQSTSRSSSCANPIEILNSDEEALLLHDSLHYEELINPSRNSVTCQTCSGLGRVPRERTNELIALVPYNDARLKPKNTKLIILSIVSTLLILFATSAVFAMPRSIEFAESKRPVKMNVTIEPLISSMVLDLVSYYYVKNWNYYPVSIVDCRIRTMYRDTLLNDVNLLNSTVPSIQIGAKQRKNVTFDVNNLLFNQENHLAFLVDQCTLPWKKYNSIPLEFEATINISYWYGHYEMVKKNGHHYVTCSTGLDGQPKLESTILT